MDVRQRPAMGMSPNTLHWGSSFLNSSWAFRYLPSAASAQAKLYTCFASILSESRAGGPRSAVLKEGSVDCTDPTLAKMRKRQDTLLALLIHASLCLSDWEGRSGSLRGYYTSNTPRGSYQSLPWLWQFFLVAKGTRASERAELLAQTDLI